MHHISLYGGSAQTPLQPRLQKSVACAYLESFEQIIPRYFPQVHAVHDAKMRFHVRQVSETEGTRDHKLFLV